MNKQLFCVARRQRDRWEAICLDLDIAVEGRSFDEVRNLLQEAVFNLHRGCFRRSRTGAKSAFGATCPPSLFDFCGLCASSRSQFPVETQTGILLSGCRSHVAPSKMHLQHLRCSDQSYIFFRLNKAAHPTMIPMNTPHSRFRFLLNSDKHFISNCAHLIT